MAKKKIEAKAPAPPVMPRHAQGRAHGTHKPGEMNKLEADYASALEIERLRGEILWWAFEAVKLKLGKLCTYTPDFLVMRRDGGLECHEVKGFWKDDARAKIRMASALYPFLFIGITREGVAWHREYFDTDGRQCLRCAHWSALSKSCKGSGVRCSVQDGWLACNKFEEKEAR